MWNIYAGLVLLAIAMYKLWQRSNFPQYARIVPSDDYDDLPDLIDTSPPPSPGDAGRAQAARQQRVHSVSPAKLIMDDDDQSVDMDELASGWRPSWGGRRSAEGRSTVA